MRFRRFHRRHHRVGRVCKGSARLKQRLRQGISNGIAHAYRIGVVTLRVFLDVVANLVLLERANAQSNLSLDRIDADHARRQFLADLQRVFRLLDPLLANFAHMDEALYAVVQPRERAERHELGHLALHVSVDGILFGNLFPRILLKLLDPNTDLLLVRVDAENLHFHFLTFFNCLGRMAVLLRPRQVAYMQQAVNAFFDLNESAIVGQIADFALDHRAHGITLFDIVPRVGHRLLDSEGNLLLVRRYAEHHDVDFGVERNDFAGVPHTAGPTHLADVDHPLDSLLELDECAVVRHADHLARDNAAHGITLFRALPGILGLLLEAEADALRLRVEVEHHHVNLVAYRNDMGRVLDAAP